MKIRILSFFSLFLIFSCTADDNCDEAGDSELVARFKTVKSGKINDTLMSGVTIYGIRIGKSDSLLFDSLTASRIVLPLDHHQDFSQFSFSINDQTDTLRIIHKTEFYLTSYTCGFAALFTIDSIYYSNPMLKKYEKIDAVIDTELELNEEHLWLYF